MRPSRFKLLIVADGEPVTNHILLNHFPLKA